MPLEQHGLLFVSATIGLVSEEVKGEEQDKKASEQLTTRARIAETGSVSSGVLTGLVFLPALRSHLPKESTRVPLGGMQGP